MFAEFGQLVVERFLPFLGGLYQVFAVAFGFVLFVFQAILFGGDGLITLLFFFGLYDLGGVGETFLFLKYGVETADVGLSTSQGHETANALVETIESFDLRRIRSDDLADGNRPADPLSELVPRFVVFPAGVIVAQPI